MLVDPFQLDLELLGRERYRTQNAESAGPAHCRNYVTAVAEREYRKLDSQLVAYSSPHATFPFLVLLDCDW
jgi:hypothetical protein